MESVRKAQFKWSRQELLVKAINPTTVNGETRMGSNFSIQDKINQSVKKYEPQFDTRMRVANKTLNFEGSFYSSFMG